MSSPPQGTRPFQFTQADPGHFSTTTRAAFTHGGSNAASSPPKDYKAEQAKRVPTPNYQREAQRFTVADAGHYDTHNKATFSKAAAAPRAPSSASPSNKWAPPKDVMTPSPGNEAYQTTTKSTHDSKPSTPVTIGRAGSRFSSNNGTSPTPSKSGSESAASPVPMKGPLERPSPSPSKPYVEYASPKPLSPSPNTADGVPHRALSYDPPTSKSISDQYTTTNRAQFGAPKKEDARIKRSYSNNMNESVPATADQWKTTARTQYEDKSPASSRINSLGRDRFKQEVVKTVAEANHYQTTTATHYSPPK